MVSIYISDVGRKNLRGYVYRGSDQSLTYKYIISPLAEFLVQFIPMWVA